MSLKVLSPRFIFPDRNSRTAAGRAVAPQDENNSATASDPLPEAADTRRKLPLGNAQLSRWSRARALRSGRRLQLKKPVVADVPPESPLADPSPVDSASSAEEVEKEEGEVGDAGTPIYMVSDGTGGTLEHAVSAALGQFEHCLVDRACSVETHLFSGIEDGDRLLEIIKQAAKEGALLLFTLADPSMLESAKQACGVWGVPFVDILGPTTEAIATYLGVAPLGISRSERRMPLSEEYFQRIEAIDFTIKQDDGAQPQNLNRAHIVLVGVSRTGKTPLSIYLAQKGYKVANVPIVMGVELPKYLFEINQEKIFGLTINPIVLQTIRKARAKTLGFIGETRSNYSEMDHVREELAFASKIYAHHPLWPVIEVTGKAIEETAAVILRTYHDRRNKCSMPRISRRY